MYTGSYSGDNFSSRARREVTAPIVEENGKWGGDSLHLP